MSMSLGSDNSGMGRQHIFSALAAIILLTFVSQCPAIITLGGTGRNTSAPTGALANSGWQYEGLAGSFTGTTISSNTFITAKHIGDLLGSNFIFDGQSYPVVSEAADPYSDLVVYTVAGTFSEYAPMYAIPAGETWNTIVMYGRSLDRGAPVVVNGQTKGWLWGGSDGSLSWGTNMVSGNYGSTFGWQFSNNGNVNEAQVASGDSGGGVFIDDGGVWKLAGIINSVEERFSLDGTDAGAMDAAIFDKSGLFEGSGSSWTKIASGGSASTNATWGYATTIASHSVFIQTAVNASTVPEPATLCIVGLGGMLLLKRSGRRSNSDRE
jgi:hypothetical protein